MSSLVFSETLWHWTSPVWWVVLAIAALYGWAFRTNAAGRVWLLIVGLVVLVMAFISPIGVLANGYLFSAHMVQHLLLLLVVPLCLVLSLPATENGWHVPRQFAGAQRLLSRPVFGWMCGIGAMWFWHVPTLCNAATQSYALGAVRSASFLLAGLAFWWPVFSPVHRRRLPPPTAVVYLFSACLGCTLLGIYITFTTVTVCPAFANPAHRLGVLTMLYDAGLTPAADQQLGGLLMWVPPCSLYVSAIVCILGRWYATEECIPGVSMASTSSMTRG